MIAIDFFCGGGGMTHGLTKAGIKVICGIDVNESCRETYTHNNDSVYICKDIKQLAPGELIEQFPAVEDSDNLLLVGCAPCQPFSSQRHAKEEHKAVNLLDEFGRFVDTLNPAHVLVENVPGIQDKGHAVFQRFLNLLKKKKYQTWYGVLCSMDYGVPQKRKRLVLIASRIFIPNEPPKTHGDGLIPYVTVRDTIAKYPHINAGESSTVFYNHKACQLSALNKKRIKATPHNGGGRSEWDETLVLDCHNNGHHGHTDVYGRMAWDEVAPTLTSKCYSLSNGRFGHPEQDRAISLREAAAIQSFDDDYEFFGSVQEVGRQIGNAVPVLLAQRLGEYILSSAIGTHRDATEQ